MLDVSGLPPEPPRRIEHRPDRRGRRWFGAAVAALVALGVLAGVSGWWLGDGRWATTPNVVGLERSAAERLVAQADLVPTITVIWHDSVAAGLVVGAEPGANQRLARGSTVMLTVSSGQPTVPSIKAGTPVAAAEQAVRDAGLTPRAGRREYDAAVPAGAVVRTDPPAGTALKSGSDVRLVVSRGPDLERKVRVPLLIGRTVEDARDELEELELDVEVNDGSPIEDRDEDEATVRLQSPVPGSLVDRGTTVTLTVS